MAKSLLLKSIPTRFLNLPRSIEIDQRPDKLMKDFIGVPMQAAGGSENK